jgi:hypothetical protein
LSAPAWLPRYRSSRACWALLDASENEIVHLTDTGERVGDPHWLGEVDGKAASVPVIFAAASSARAKVPAGDDHVISTVG